MKDARAAGKHSRRTIIRSAGFLFLLGILIAFLMEPMLAAGTQPSPPVEKGPTLELASATSSEEHGLGFLPSDPTEHPIVPLPARVASITELPPAVDLTQPPLIEGRPSIQGQPSEDGLPPVGDQGTTNTCVGWATSYYYKTYQEWLEHGWDLENGGPHYDHIFSVNFVYNQVAAQQPDVACVEGAEIGDALQLIVNDGDVPWNIFPWNPYDCSIKPAPWQWDAAQDYTGIDYGAFFISIGPPHGPEQNHSLTPLKQWLQDNDPFIIGLPIYAEFDYAGCSVPVMPPSDPGSYRGLHAVTVVGYDDNFGGVGAFKIVNSWGTSWGCSGYAWLSYEFVQKYAWEAWWMTSNRSPWIDPRVPDRYAQVGTWIEVHLNPYENDREESHPAALEWWVDQEDNCIVHNEAGANDVLFFQPDPSDYEGYDAVLLRLVDSEGAEDTQWITLGWFDFTSFYYLPLGFRNYPN